MPPPTRSSPQRPGRVALKGMFSEGLWHCNCNPRLPAERFQTKNGRQNHGRWFYTCQKKTPRGCGFFLWEDEAKAREARAVLANSRSEPISPPRAPSSAYASSFRPSAGAAAHSPAICGAAARTDASDAPDWPHSDAERRMAMAADRAAMPPPPETPRKQARRDPGHTSPGKRRLSEDDDGSGADVFSTPDTRPRAAGGLMTPAHTPASAGRMFRGLELERPPLPNFGATPARGRPGLGESALMDSPFGDGPSPDTDLSRDVLAAMESLSVEVGEEAREAVRAVAFRYTRKMRGLEKGRDISRGAVDAKAREVERLENYIAAMEEGGARGGRAGRVVVKTEY